MPGTYTLNDGAVLPAVGFGTYPLKGEHGIAAVTSALEVGYRLLDTAVNYGNEEEVGEAIRRSGVPRDEVLVASKIPGRHHGYDDAIRSTKESLHRLQTVKDTRMKIRTALVTARSAPAHERAVRTLMEWNIAVDELMFLGGLDKGEFLKAFEPDFYFDDQRGHIDSARAHVAAGHVPFGVANLARGKAP